jgi:ubiquinone/menaquinone biosynthesis C-methylase UbiE
VPVPDDTALHLLPPSSLLQTGPVDHADWNYRPLIGTVQRLRFRLIKRLLDGQRFGRLLEIGYGSGVFMPELARHADELFGIDPHPMPQEVEAVLREHGVTARLVTGSAESLPYADSFLDCVVSVSAMEYVEDIESACRELARVLRPGGIIVIATPGVSPIWDLALKLSTGESPGQYADRRQRLLPTLKHHFATDREISVPALGGRLFRLYTGVRLKTGT